MATANFARHPDECNPADDDILLTTPAPRAAEVSEYQRVKLFLTIQILFLFLTPFCGGFRFALWSMMDSALMIQAIGITALAAVLEDDWQRSIAFKVAVLFYLSSIAAMGMAVLISGVTTWGLASWQ